MEQRHLYGTVDYTSLVKARNTLSRILLTSQNEAEKHQTDQEQLLHTTVDMRSNDEEEEIEENDDLMAQVEVPPKN